MKKYAPFLILLIAVINCVNPGTGSTGPKPTASQESRPIDAQVSLSRVAVTVKNTGKYPFPAVRMKINMGGLGGYDGVYDGGSLAPGKSMTIPLNEFTDGGSNRFNPFTKKVNSIYLKSGDGAASLFQF